MKKSLGRKAISILLAVLMATTGLVPAFSAYADDGVENYYEIQLYYKDDQRIVPSTMLNEKGEEVEFIQYMTEGDELNLTYKLIDTQMPDNGRIFWYSETPTLVDVNQDGVVKAFDSSKGAVIHSWIDNEVKTVPVIGKIMGKAIEKALFNDKVDVDAMDTDAIVAVIEGLFEVDGALGNVGGAYKDRLINSLREYLDNINSNIHVCLYSDEGKLLSEDIVKICVNRCDEWYANFLPNGTHITNKSQIDTTVAVGSTCQLYAITTPVRLHYGTVYSVKSTSIFEQGKVVATVDDGGLVTFRNTGTVTIMVSPDSEQVIQNILKLVNYFYTINTDMIDTKQLADILIKYVGIDMNRNVLAALLDACFIIADIAGDSADPVKLSATAVKIIANLVLQFKYNDTITFNVVESEPLRDFNIDDSVTTVKEGEKISLKIKDIQPSVGDTSDIVWSSADPSIAYVDPETGVVTGRDAGKAYGELSSQTCEITATSPKYNVSKTVTVTVTGKTGNNLSDVEISGADYLEMGQEADYTYQIFPKRVAEASGALSANVYTTWGIVTGENEDGETEYAWATEEEPATDGKGEIDINGHYKVISGGVSTIAIQAKTGYTVGSRFVQTSSCIGTYDITNGIPIEAISIDVTGCTSNGKIGKDNTVTINGEDHRYITIKKGALEAYAGNGAWFAATVYPENASNQNLTWVIDNTSKYETHSKDDLNHSITVECKAGIENASSVNVYAVSADGTVRSNTITVCLTRNYVTANAIDSDNIDVINGYTANVTHSPSFDGNSLKASACYQANWFSSDESIFTVNYRGDDDGNAVVRGVDVGVATLYCVSADGAVIGTSTVTVHPDKTYLKEIIDLCEKTAIKKTPENSKLYKQYMNKLDLAYSIYNDKDMASQTACDTYADKLLTAFYQLGGFVGIKHVDLIDESGNIANNGYYTVEVKSLNSYKDYSYDFDCKINPSNAMYSNIEWSSSNPDITVDKHGRCSPNKNDPCTAVITCTVTDYMGGQTSSSVFVAFAKDRVTGVEISPASIDAGKIYTTQTINALVLPKKAIGSGSSASCTEVLWSTSDPKVATVNKNGEVTFISEGQAVITVTTVDGGFTAQCPVNVVPNYDALINLIGQCDDEQLVEINYHPITWSVYQNALTQAKDMVANNSSHQEDIDTMVETLTAAHDGLEKYNYIQSIELYLDGQPTSEFYQYDLSLLTEGVSYKNAKLQLKVRLKPNNGSYDTVTWESSNPSIAVDGGLCTLTENKSAYGSILCTVSDHYGNSFSDTVWVSFSYRPVTKMEMSETEIAGAIGDQRVLTCTPKSNNLLLTPDIKDFYWASDDESVATVSQDGIVTFVATGSTIIRAISYDGGVTGECRVSTNGDRNALAAAIDRANDIEYTDYEYEYGMAFKSAYEAAQVALTDTSYTQTMIDEATADLVAALDALEGHEYQAITDLALSYVTYSRNISNKSTQVATGTVGSNDAVSVDLSSGYSNYNDYNDIVITAVSNPTTTHYKSLTWTVDGTSNMDTTVDNQTIKLTPQGSATNHQKNAIAVVTAAVTDDYDRVTSRSIVVVMSDSVCKSFDITPSAMTITAKQSDVEIPYTITDCAFKDVLWFSSDESVVRVENGKLYPVDRGIAQVTGKTVDGGYTDSVTVTVTADFSELAQKYSDYSAVVDNSRGRYIYTEETLDILSALLAEAEEMIDSTATQEEIDALVASLDEAYNGLEEYVAVNSVSLTADTENNSNVTVNGKFIRYKGTILSNRTIQLVPVFNADNAKYESIAYTSSNSNITVDENGLVTNKTSALDNSAIAMGDITVTVTNVYEETYTDTVRVTFVRNEVTAITFSNEMVYGAPAQTVTLKPTITGDIKTCEYTSSNPQIASVDQNGVVTFNSQGEATITATTVDGGLTATITAYTTWDTTALKSAIDDAKALTYTDYAYSYGMALKSALEAAEAVYSNYLATQSEIDTACANLTTAVNEAVSNPFIAPTFTFTCGSKTLKSGDKVEVDGDTNQAVITVGMNSNAMVSAPAITTSNESNCLTDITGNAITVTKGNKDGSMTITVTAVDDYGRSYTSSVNLFIVSQLINATAIVLTDANGNVLNDTHSIACGGLYSRFPGLTIKYNTTPANANAIVEVRYTSSKPENIAVSDEGVVTLAPTVPTAASYDSVITVQVTNMDGTTCSKSVSLTISRR